MAGPRDKGKGKAKAKAKASRTGDASIKMKIGRQRAAAAFAAAYPFGPEDAAHQTKEIMAFDVAHKLRSGRRVLVPNTDKPGPQPFRKGEKPVYDLSWQIPACVKVAMEHYNLLNEDDVHVLVKAVDGRVSLFNGEWGHVNFIAKSKQGGPPKGFFAELKIKGMKEISCTMCTKMEPDDPKTAPVRGECGLCPRRIFHPTAGGYIGANPAAGGCQAEHLGDAPGGGSAEFASLFNVDLL